VRRTFWRFTRETSQAQEDVTELALQLSLGPRAAPAPGQCSLFHDLDFGDAGSRCSGRTHTVRTISAVEVTVKGSEKPKKLQKKQPQKTLKERRSEKRAAAAAKKFGSS
jgi:hypothetical protein